MEKGKPLKRDEKGRLVKGTPPGPGRTLGSLDFKTKFFKAIEIIAKQKGLTSDQTEQQLFLIGFKKSKEGNFNFYRDTMDRLYGKPKESVDVTSDNKVLKRNVIVFKSFKDADSK